MTELREQDKIQILLDKATLYLRFSLSFTAISFPLISLSSPISIQEIPEMMFILTSLISFALSVIFSLFAYNGLNKLKEKKVKDTIGRRIYFYSNYIYVANYANIIGFFLMILYLSLLFTNSIYVMIFTAGAIAIFIILIELMKKSWFYKKDFKKLRIYLILGVLAVLIMGVIIILIPFISP